MRRSRAANRTDTGGSGGIAVDSRAEVDRVHAIAVDAGWTTVRDPKVFTRFSDRYYASFVEDDNGIRIEFVHNPPRESVEG